MFFRIFKELIVEWYTKQKSWLRYTTWGLMVLAIIGTLTTLTTSTPIDVLTSLGYLLGLFLILHMLWFSFAVLHHNIVEEYTCYREDASPDEQTTESWIAFGVGAIAIIVIVLVTMAITQSQNTIIYGH